MNTKGIKETRDLLVAVGGLVRDALKSAEDGKVTAWESVKIGVANLGPVIEACAGVADVPGELMDLTPEEMDELYIAVMGELGWSERRLARNIFDTIFNWVRGSLLRS